MLGFEDIQAHVKVLERIPKSGFGLVFHRKYWAGYLQLA